MARFQVVAAVDAHIDSSSEGARVAQNNGSDQPTAPLVIGTRALSDPHENVRQVALAVNIC